MHDAPGSLVPPLTLENEQGVDAFAQGLAAARPPPRCRAAVAFLVDLEGFEKIASELLELGEEVAPLGPRLALHEATRDKHANIDADETAAVIADILEWRRARTTRCWKLNGASRSCSAAKVARGIKCVEILLDAMTAPFWAGEQKVTSEQNLSVLGDAAQRRAQICAQQALHESPCEETLLALDDARGHLRSVALAALAVDRFRRRGVSMRQRRERGPRLLHGAQDEAGGGGARRRGRRRDRSARGRRARPRTLNLGPGCPPSRCGPRPSTIRWERPSRRTSAPRGGREAAFEADRAVTEAETLQSEVALFGPVQRRPRRGPR